MPSVARQQSFRPTAAIEHSHHTNACGDLTIVDDVHSKGKATQAGRYSVARYARSGTLREEREPVIQASQIPIGVRLTPFSSAVPANPQ